MPSSFKKGICIFSSILNIILFPASIFAVSESDWDMYDLNNIFYYDGDGMNCTPSSVASGENSTYSGNEVFSSDQLSKIASYQSTYEKVANEFGIPWQLLAVLHVRETNLGMTNPANGQGVYQLYSYTAGGSNNNRFTPGPVSEEEFERQTRITAGLIKNNYASGLNLNTDDGVKTFFFRYNGAASAYIAQARSLGFSEAEAKRGEGSPYVMNLADERRDSKKNSSWRQILTDGGSMQTANQVPGAFVMFSAMGGGTGIAGCTGSSAHSGDINATALELAWPSHGHGLTPTDAYRKALQSVGLSNYGDRFAAMGASCDAFVATVMRYSGADPNFVCCGVSNGGATYNYVANSGKYVEVPNDPRYLQPGDIRMSNGHIELYVEVNGVGKIASASYGTRTGEIGNFYDNSATFKAYRLKR
ncbi:MAG: hypothetical protein Q4E47_03155 [Candidatus Saccharibacteria bacterium]|nr:hypothetical protein [Candidatus Saccharibacteria bacterium]